MNGATAQYELNTSILEYVKPEIRNTYVFPISSQCAKRITNRILLLHTESWWLNGSQSLSFTHLYMSYPLWISYLFTKLWLLFVTAAFLFCLQKKTYYFANRPHIFRYVEGIKIIAQRNWILLLGKSIQLLIVFSYIAELQCNTSSYQRIEITKWNTSIMKTIDAGLLTCHRNSREMRPECEDITWFSCSDCVMFERALYPFIFGCWFF